MKQKAEMSATGDATEQVCCGNESVDTVFSRHVCVGSVSAQQDVCTTYFDTWPEQQQTGFVERLLSRMCHFQQGQINNYLLQILQRDFISSLPEQGHFHLAEKILSYLDPWSLCQAEQVCSNWFRVIAEGRLWKRLIERNVRSDPAWSNVSRKRKWGEYLFHFNTEDRSSEGEYFRRMFPCILRDIQRIEQNWRTGNHELHRIHCHSENSKGVYCLQYDDDKIVSGLRDNTIKIWERPSLKCSKIMTGHTGSVLCLQYDDNVIITGSSDTTIRVWSITTGEMLNMMQHHSEAVLHLRFAGDMLVTCSKDRNIAVWRMHSPTHFELRESLMGHRAAVNVVDFDDRYIVSASGDRTLRVWKTSDLQHVRTLNGHRRGIACLQYRDRLVVSGSSDNTIRLWDVDCGACLRTLEGHNELVRCIRFDDRRIVSGAYDGTIKVWDLKAALDPRSPGDGLCLRTLVEHRGRVFRLQFDTFQIVSSSHDDTILIWDFVAKRSEDNDLEPPWEVDDSDELDKNESTNLGTSWPTGEQSQENTYMSDDDDNKHISFYTSK